MNFVLSVVRYMVQIQCVTPFNLSSDLLFCFSLSMHKGFINGLFFSQYA